MKAPHGHIAWREGEDTCEHHHVLQVDGLCVSYGKVPALREVTFRSRCGKSLALVGPNGAGKSTLLKTLAGLLRAECGEIRWRGRAMIKSSHEIAYLPQREEIDWNFPATVRGIVEMGRYPHVGWWRRYRRRDAERVTEALRAMDLLDLQDRHISALSGGQQQRAFLARALAQEAHVFLLDEPFTGLDADAQERLGMLIGELKREGRLIIASHHDLESVPVMYDDVLLLALHQVAYGPVNEVFTEQALRRTYGREMMAVGAVLAGTEVKADQPLVEERAR